MKNVSKITQAVAMAITLGATPLSQASENDVLRVGCDGAFAPFTYIDDNGQITGFDIDLIKKIGETLGYKKVEIMPMPFDGIIPALMTGHIDVIISGFTISEERAKRVDFTDPYYRCGLSFLTKDDKSYQNLEDLNGKEVCVQIGTTGALYLQKNYPNIQLKQFNSPPETYVELKNGGCVAVLNDNPVNDFFLNKSHSKGIVSKAITTQSNEYYGIAVNKGNKELLDKMNKGLDTVIENGEFAKISKDWFGYDITDTLKK